MPGDPGGDRIPEVDAVLVGMGLGRMEPGAIPFTFPGRNENWAGRTEQGAWVFVKRFTGPHPDALRRLRRSIAFERLSASLTPSVTPSAVGWDEESRLLVSKFIDDATSGADLVARRALGPDLSFRAGRVVGAVHRLPANHALPEDLLSDQRPLLPSAELMCGLTLPVFYASSAGELKAWKLMQDDEELARAVRSLLAWEERAPRVPAHCDLRLDQLLLGRDCLYVTDWEEFRLADAARDVGSFTGEWLHRAVTGWAEPGCEVLSGGEIVRLCARAMDHVRPMISAFWAGYREARPRCDPDLAQRAAAFAGWHLLDRMLAAARPSVRLSAMHRAAAGIGRTIMCAPAESAATVGLGRTA